MMTLSLEFVTYEASQSVHSYHSIYFEFGREGGVDTDIQVVTMCLNNYSTNTDYVRLVLEIVYLLLLVNNMYSFFKKIKNMRVKYDLWYQMEVVNLSDVEIKQRNLTKPECSRKIGAIIQGFTIIDIIYMILTIGTIGLWVLYNEAGIAADFNNTPISDAEAHNELINDGEIPPYVPPKDYYSDYYFLVFLMQIHTNVVAINSIFISVRVFDYINKSRNVKIISNTMYGAREDTMYFIIIFLVLICGFVGMSYLSFGQHYEGYDTLKSSLRMNF
jgi:hypothetical protein